MALASGTRLGAYQVVAQIGAGTKDESCRTRDTRYTRYFFFFK